MYPKIDGSSTLVEVIAAYKSASDAYATLCTTLPEEDDPDLEGDEFSAMRQARNDFLHFQCQTPDEVKEKIHRIAEDDFLRETCLGNDEIGFIFVLTLLLPA